jgi:hypothetical protein
MGHFLVYGFISWFLERFLVPVPPFSIRLFSILIQNQPQNLLT